MRNGCYSGNGFTALATKVSDTAIFYSFHAGIYGSGRRSPYEAGIIALFSIRGGKFMFLPKFVLKGNLQARTHTRPPLPHSVHDVRGDMCPAAPQGAHA